MAAGSIEHCRYIVPVLHACLCLHASATFNVGLDRQGEGPPRTARSQLLATEW
jgi:hypothetical protein